MAGIELGGLDRPSAASKLKAGVADLVSTPIGVVSSPDGQTRTINPANYSLAIDEEASVDSVVGFSLDPARLWAHLVGGKEVDPILTYNDKQLADVVNNLATQSDVAPVNAALAYEGTTPTVTPATEGFKAQGGRGYRDSLLRDLLARATRRASFDEVGPGYHHGRGRGGQEGSR